MGDEWKPNSILTNKNFSEKLPHNVMEFFMVAHIGFSFEIQENSNEFHYEVTRHCRFPSHTPSDSYTIRLMIGEDFRASPMKEALFYQQLREDLGQDKSNWMDSFIKNDIIGNDWGLQICWNEIRELKREGIEIIEDVKSYFIEKPPDYKLPSYLSDYIQSQSINRKGTNDYYFDYSPLLRTFRTIFAHELDGDGFDYNKFIKHFEDKLNKSLSDILSNLKFDADERYFSYKRWMSNIVDLSGEEWKVNADNFAGDYSMLINEVIYLCLRKSNKLELLGPFEQLIEVI